MSLVYRFRITFEDYDEVSRDIEIKSSQSFEDLHHIIQSSIKFDSTKPASFFISNDNWVKGQEITLEKKKDNEGKLLALMKDSKLRDFISDPHQKIYYVSDYDANWTFFVELVKILPTVEMTKTYPVCVKSTGEPPKQYSIISKPVIPDEDFEEILVAEEEVAEEEEDLMEEAEDGVEIDEIEGMSEEGEEDSTGDEMEMGEEAGEADQKEEDY